MKSSLPDRRVVRQYLLGRLDEQKELESDLSEGVLFNDDLSEMVDSIEDEIIEEYLDGALVAADRNAVEEYFLRPPERKEKLRFARLLRHRFETKQSNFAEPHLDVLPLTHPVRSRTAREVGPVAYWSSHFRAYWQIAALILLTVVSLTYISAVLKKQARLETELVRERERSASLATAPLSLAAAALLQPSVIALTLVSDRSRTTGTELPHIEINSSTQRIIVEIALPGVAPGPYDVRLESKGEKGSMWSAKLLPLVSPFGDSRLMFDVPAQSFESGVSSFVVSSSRPQGEWRKQYDFQARVTK